MQMCDALSRNMPKDLRVLLGNCLVHGRRNFLDVVEYFPAEVRYVLECLKKVYKTDAEAKKQQLSADERLRLHQQQSGPVMEQLRCWLKAQLDEKRVEPNSSLGGAINYMENHWKALTLFLRVPGAPLDNNVCERALKMAIRHRKNSLFYKTSRGAAVGDLYMSLIHTCYSSGASPVDYLTELQRNHQRVRAAPGDWMPWNYREQLAATESGPDRGRSPPAVAPADGSCPCNDRPAPRTACRERRSWPGEGGRARHAARISTAAPSPLTAASEADADPLPYPAPAPSLTATPRCPPNSGPARFCTLADSTQTMHGAALLYNHLLQQKRAREKENGAVETRYDWPALLADWAARVRQRWTELKGWYDRREEFWQLMPIATAQVPRPTQMFVRQWCRLVYEEPGPETLTGSKIARQLIVEREIRLKGKRARLSNPRALERWGGASGDRQIDYRWLPTVRDIVRDIVVGCQRKGDVHA